MRRRSRSLAAVHDCHIALAVIFVMGPTLAGFVGIGMTRLAPIGRAQLGLQVEEGLGSFDRLPVRWAILRGHYAPGGAADLNQGVLRWAG